MKEIFLNCDSPCFSCPVYDRMIKISHFSQRKLHESYYCNHCDIYSLCKFGLAYKRGHNGKLNPTCTKCGNFVERIELSYVEGQNHKPFDINSLLVIRKENGIKYEINDITEKKYINELLILFEKLTLIGFGLTEPNMFEDEKYRILITPSRKKRFYIKDQNNNKMYYSKKYEQEQNGNVLYAFINYLKNFSRLK